MKFFSKRKAKATAPKAQSHDLAATARLAGLEARLAPSLAADTWERPQKPPADWKKILLLTGLGTLSWISTYTGMLELIQANMGEIGFVYKLAIAFAVAMLMLMIIWLLDQLFTRLAAPVRLLFVAGYLFLTLISVGFGFGFYWKFLESRSEATRSAESAVTQVQSALLAAQTRLEQLDATLGQLTKISAQKAIDEREKGNSCPASRPGDGPRRRLRDADASKFGFAGRFVSERAASVKQDIAVLNGDLAKVMNRDKSTFDPKTGTRNTFLKNLGRKLNSSVTRFNAFRTDPQLRQFRTDFADRSTKSVFDNGRGGTFSCPDPELQTALRGVVRAIDQLPELEKPEVAAVEGSEAIIEAFRRLTTTLSGLATLKMPPTPDELRVAQQRAVQSVRDVAQQRRLLQQQPGLGERDYIPLFIALFVDFCLLLVSVSRPMQGFQWLEHKMGSAQDGPIIKILSRFRDIHQDDEIRDVFEVFRHVVFDVRGVYYAAIPMNATDPTSTSDLEPNSALEAQLLANLFTSFENDKVYRRVVAPLFTTTFIQKKLRSQGSKFYEAEAVRLYRFEKDQWQDWMLSAMMGAAKRVEARKSIESELFASDVPELKAHPEPVDEDNAPSLGEPAEDDADTEAREEFEKQIAAEIDETLFNQTYDRQQVERQREIEADAKVHILHANGGRTPEHIIALEAAQAVVNGAFAPVSGEVSAPIASKTTVAPEEPAPAQVAAVEPGPHSTSLAARAGGAWTAHKTGHYKPSEDAVPTIAATNEPTKDPAEEQVQEQDVRPGVAAVADPAPQSQMTQSAPIQPQSATLPQNHIRPETPKMPAVQVHDALPKSLQVKPVHLAPVGNDTRTANPPILSEPTSLPAILGKSASSVAKPEDVIVAEPVAGNGPNERREPQFKAPVKGGDQDEMVENITNWFNQGKAKKRWKWTRS
ncbi:MAG: hypothetical protein ACR2O4_05920 [Hyphomicrobiaceae bacterium]